jgi:hypothetical protein
MAERETNKTTMKTIEIEKENMENNEKHETDDDPKIIYRGWKVMPFIIGTLHTLSLFLSVVFFFFFYLIMILFFFNRK